MNSDTLIKQIFPQLSKKQEKALARLNLETLGDLLYHFPSRYLTVDEVKYVKDLEVGDKVVLYGQIDNLKTAKGWRSGTPMAKGRLSDETGSIDLVWFNQPYIAKMLKEGSTVKLEGKVQERQDNLYIANPDYENLAKLPEGVGTSLFADDNQGVAFSIPVYPVTRGINSKWFVYAIKKILASGLLDQLVDPIPEEIREKLSLPDLASALVWIHQPQKSAHAESAKKRFSFEEIFTIQVIKARQRQSYEAAAAFAIDIPRPEIDEFITSLPFTPTKAQSKAVEAILDDLSSAPAMSRLLEGDVGSGKTMVAATTALSVIESPPPEREYGRLQVAYMAPTGILARQHFQSFIEYFSHMSVEIGLITGSGCAKFPSKVNPQEPTHVSRSQLLRWVKKGQISILIGTHALIYKSVEFQNLAYVIIDEQHRFGVNQRKKLARKGGPLPHLLSMTATPIPRTLALTLYGDLDISVLDELPPGRSAVETSLVSPDDREDVYEEVKERLDKGEQAYVICPRVHEPDENNENALLVKSVEGEHQRLKDKVFTDYQVGKVHGQMRPAKKKQVMQDFSAGDIDVLVATSVIEVGVNVPNSTVIIIEDADRYGLAQLHQLRGRVQRSTTQGKCFAFSDTKREASRERLAKFAQATDGFKLAEYDLQHRGTGELIGTRQSGVSDIGMEALRNLKLVEHARQYARDITKKDQYLTSHPGLERKVQSLQAHFE